jgi:hypothetical protein
MLNNNRDQPQYWRERAEDALTDAKSVSNSRMKASLLGVAKAYEIIAKRAEVKIKLVPEALRAGRGASGGAPLRAAPGHGAP